MYNLSEQAQKLIEDFERQIETVPANERNAVLKRMTSHIAALNEDVKGLYNMLQRSENAHGDDADRLRDAM